MLHVDNMLWKFKIEKNVTIWYMATITRDAAERDASKKGNTNFTKAVFRVETCYIERLIFIPF